jgi:hypothetical protein
MVADIADSVIEKATTRMVLDQILDESLRTSARKPIMYQFNPSSKAIWSHWKGTVFSESWRSVIRHIAWCLVVYLFFRRFPAAKDPLAEFSVLWGQALSVTTFTLTFFVNQAYTLWQSCLMISRTLQGRLADLSMALAAKAVRTDPQTIDGCSVFTPVSRDFLLMVARYVRLFNLLSYASFTRSHRPLLTPSGMRRMVERGLMTAKEREVLIRAPISATQRHNTVLMWTFRAILDASKAGIIEGGPGFEQQIIAKVQEIRALGNSIESALRGRMPFAYAHIVQVLVDLILWSYPLMALSSGMPLFLGLIGTGLLTTCYQGLFDLAKQFLDPFHNENFWAGDDPLMVDTLIAETNALSLRWMYGLDEMPVSYHCYKAEGGFQDFILPDEGYTLKEVGQMEEERIRQASAESESIEALPDKEYEETVALRKAAKERELEETKLILNAPPGADFVPGLDDDDEDEDDDFGEMDVVTEPRSVFSSRNDTNNDGMQNFENFLEAVEDEIEEAEQMEEVRIRQASAESERVEALPDKEYEEKVALMKAAEERELEETKLILRAPPGADFVPGLDDDEDDNNDLDDRELSASRHAMDVDTGPRSVFGSKDDTHDGKQNFENFLDAVEDEIDEARERADGSPTTSVGSVDER